jgi:hypothetical protein
MSRNPSSRRSGAIVVAMGLAVCLGIYTASYFYLLDPPSRWYLIGGVGSLDINTLPDGTQGIVVGTRYRFRGQPVESEAIRMIFWPANQIDRNIRRDYWSPSRPTGSGEGFF